MYFPVVQLWSTIYKRSTANLGVCVSSLEKATNFVSKLLSQKGMSLSDMEGYALEAAWESKTYTEISEKYNVSVHTLQVQSGPVLWRKLSNILGKKIGKKALRKVVFEEMLETERRAANLEEKGDFLFIGGSLPPVEGFFGRQEELNELCTLVNKYSCLILNGAEGIGKKSLLSKMLQSMQHKLPLRKVLWKTLNHKPTPVELEKELHNLINDPPSENLIATLTSSPFLIVLDSLDSILNVEKKGEPILDERYASLFRRIAEETLSRLVIIANQPTPATDDMILRGRAGAYYLRGLNLFEAKAVLGSQWDCESAKEVWRMTGGSPLILRELANWSDYVEELNSQLQRMTVISSIVSSLYANMIRRLRLSTDDMTILKEIAKHTKGLTFTRLLAQRPRSIATAGRLIDMGLASKESNSKGETVIRAIPLLSKALTGL